MALPDPNRSLWMGTSPATSYPPLDGARAVEVVVIGAGVTGLTTALLVAQRGMFVAVVEAHRVAAGTTGITTAKMTSLHALTYAQLIESAGEDMARRYGQANEAAIKKIRTLVDSLGIDAKLTRASAYTYTLDSDQRPTIEAEVATAPSLSCPPRSRSTPICRTRWRQRPLRRPVALPPPPVFARLGRGPRRGRRHHLRRFPGHRHRCTRRRDRRDHARRRSSSPSGRCRHSPAVPRHRQVLRQNALVPDSSALSVRCRGPLPAACTSPLIRLLDPYIGRCQRTSRVYVATGFKKRGMTGGTVAAMIISDLIARVQNPWRDVLHATRSGGGVQAVKRFVKKNASVGMQIIKDREKERDR